MPETKSTTAPKSKNLLSVSPDKMLVIQYILFIICFGFLVGLFSLFMAGVASLRNEIAMDNYDNTARIYNGQVKQEAPNLGAVDRDDRLYSENGLTEEKANYYATNTFLQSTDANVEINVEYVKKGLFFQPTYRTQFNAVYLLENALTEESIVNFVFPFPANIVSNEISGAKLLVNGEEVTNSKFNSLGSYDYEYVRSQSGLKWSGKIPANGSAEISISYETVGLSVYTYEGIENTNGAQDFHFTAVINGTKAYDVVRGLSVDNRIFGNKTVTLEWDKPDLYSRPLVELAVADRLNPSEQVSRIYLTMAPVYVVLMSVLLYLAYRFGKKLGLFDAFVITILFTLYFPFIHYLSSFTIDPTSEIFANVGNVGYFTLPLYLAFLLAFVVICGIIYYFLARVSGFKFASKFGIPTLVLFMGFFPLVVTVPEYSMLFVLIGLIALMAIVVQARVKMLS